MFHDQTFLGWLTTGLYAAAASLCAAAAMAPASARPRVATPSSRTSFFWWLMCAGLVLLAINKQLDLQTALTDYLRDVAQRDGWYGSRRILQLAFVAVAILLCAAGAWFIYWMLGPRWRTHGLALAGLGLLLVYLLLRVADIERLGEATGLPVAAIGVRDVVEWVALLTIAMAGWRQAVLLPGARVVP